MDRQILMFILGLGCFWLVLDEFVGKQVIGQLIDGTIFTGGGVVPGPTLPEAPEEKEEKEEKPFDPKERVPDLIPKNPLGPGGVIV